MKLYVLPIERACNAHCGFCITYFRYNAPREILSLDCLERSLVLTRPDKIEITGGGEPTLHQDIEKIIEYCSKHASTQMYTNGARLKNIRNLHLLETLCISIAHYNLKENERIMGINPDLEILYSLPVPSKFSLILHKSGIHTVAGVIDYLRWARNYTSKIVVRQLFDHDYRGKLIGEFVSSQEIFKGLGSSDYSLTPQGNPVLEYENLQVEFEYRSCACELDNPVLHADGKMHRGWTEEILNDFNRA